MSNTYTLLAAKQELTNMQAQALKFPNHDEYNRVTDALRHLNVVIEHTKNIGESLPCNYRELETIAFYEAWLASSENLSAFAKRHKLTANKAEELVQLGGKLHEEANKA